MEAVVQFFSELIAKFGGVIFVPIVIFSIVGIGAQWMFYEKCRQPGIACIVPFWNVIVFLKIVGRPAWQTILVCTPPVIAGYLALFHPLTTLNLSIIGAAGLFWVGFMGKVYIEICNSFGRKSVFDYVCIILFNGLYILNLGLSHDAKYRGPVYKKQGSTNKATQLA